jgi:hypothetical protein
MGACLLVAKFAKKSKHLPKNPFAMPIENPIRQDTDVHGIHPGSLQFQSKELASMLIEEARMLRVGWMKDCGKRNEVRLPATVRLSILSF